jgi:hypothetical protein
MGDTMGEGIRLTGPRAGDDKEGSCNMTIGADAVLDGSTLRWIECFEI